MAPTHKLLFYLATAYGYIWINQNVGEKYTSVLLCNTQLLKQNKPLCQYPQYMKLTTH